MLTRKFAIGLGPCLIKELWPFADGRIAVRFAYEWHAVASIEIIGSEKGHPMYPL
ncbi:nuclear transport factor 2 family protein [Paenibacillus polysaccharolyticus]|nr:nuclear transport factor 2 family protein [Paenibacillus polysaccharolyticus]